MTTWTNWAGNISGTIANGPPLLKRPGDVDSAIAAALASNAKVRIVGGSYSMSPILTPNSSPILLNLTTLSFDDGSSVHYPAKGAPKEPTNPGDFVWVCAGATVQHVLDTLGAAKPVSMTLAMVGAFSGQTLVGAISTGTHGSGFRYGTLADLVVALEIATVVRDATGVARATRMVVAGEDGIFSDLAADTALFNALVVGIGAVGVVTAVLLRVVPMKLLAKENEPAPILWSAVKSDWLAPSGADGRPTAFLTGPRGDVDSAGILIFPYRVGGDDYYCVVSREYIVGASAPGAAKPQGPPCAFLTKIAGAWLSGLSFEQAKHALRQEIVSQGSPPLQCGPSPLILTSTSGFGSLKGYGIEYAFPVDSTGGYILAIEAMLDAIDALGQGSSPELIPGFISLRFQGPSRALLAHRPGPTCTVEILTCTKPGQGAKVLAAAETAALAHGGKPHWGEVFGMSTDVSHFDPGRLASIAASSRTELQAFRQAVEGAGIDPETFLNDALTVMWNA